MTVTVEVPKGMKWCKCCGGVFDKEDGFHKQKKFSKAAGAIKLYPCTICKRCNNERRLITGAKRERRNPDAAPVETSLPRVASEIVNAAWLEALVVYRRAGKLHWRARHRELPAGAEIIGAYDKGARFDCVLADLRQ